MEIRIGTSGYSFDDWRLNFYPAKIAKGKMLDFYKDHFNTVEINSTYYGVPHPAVMANMVRKTPPEFEFIVKANRTLTHDRRQFEKPARNLMEAVSPIAERGQLKGILAQFPWSFKFSPNNLRYLVTCRDIVGSNRLFVEFRHDSWLRRDTFKIMENENISYVSVDGPRLRGLMPPELKVTGDTAYIRLHGRNADHWWGGGALRYDYLYSDSELTEWKERLDKLKGDIKKAFIFFNNCHLGQAVKNAQDMKRILGL